MSIIFRGRDIRIDDGALRPEVGLPSSRLRIELRHMPQQQWLLGIAGDRPVACELNHISEHLIAVRAGVGVAGLPCFIGDRDPDLIRVGGDIPSFGRDIWLLVHRDLSRTPAVRAVIDFAAVVISDNRDLSIR
jgi:DNA-binding transcriptional LysR family regulator